MHFEQFVEKYKRVNLKYTLATYWTVSLNQRIIAVLNRWFFGDELHKIKHAISDSRWHEDCYSKLRLKRGSEVFHHKFPIYYIKHIAAIDFWVTQNNISFANWSLKKFLYSMRTQNWHVAQKYAIIKKSAISLRLGQNDHLMSWSLWHVTKSQRNCG